MHPGFPHPFKDMYNHQVRQFKRLPLRISQWALLEMKENFRRGGYYDESGRFIKWKKRRGDRSLVHWKKNSSDSSRALLILTSRLRRSLKASPIYYTARVVTDVPYAEAHQKGFKGVVTQKIKAFTRRKMGKFGVIKTKALKKSTAISFGRGQVGQVKVKAYTRKVKMNIPQRPFLEVGKQFFTKVETTVLNELDQLFLKS